MDSIALAKTIGQLVGTGVVAGLVVLGGLWLLKSALSAALTRSVNRDLENLRHEMSKKLEALRYELSLDAHKAHLRADKRHELYPETLARVRAARDVVEAHLKEQTGGWYEDALRQIDGLSDLLEDNSLFFESSVKSALKTATKNIARVLSRIEDARVNSMNSSDTVVGEVRVPLVQSALDDAEESINALERSMSADLQPKGTGQDRLGS